MLAGATAGLLVGGTKIGSRPRPKLMALGFALTGALADLDLLFGVHSGPSHGLGWALFSGLMTLWTWLKPPRTAGVLRTAAAVAIAYATHPLLDWLSTDTTPPYGIQALWPLSNDYYLSSLRIFLPVSRRYWLAEAWWLNLRAVARELLILGPLFWIVWRFRREHP
jgi:membrane-bound metal-dependent hydrolase YbcI (DUF457 family)